MAFRYPPVKHWLVPENLFERTIECVLPETRQGKESGALWLGAREEVARVSMVLFPRGTGVRERRYCWEVSSEVLGAVTRWAIPQNLCLLGVVHTHLPGVPPVLSPADRAFGVRVPGVLAIVMSNGGYEADYRHWGWYVFEGDDFRQLGDSEIARRVRVDRAVEVKLGTANAEGVWPEAGE